MKRHTIEVADLDGFTTGVVLASSSGFKRLWLKMTVVDGAFVPEIFLQVNNDPDRKIATLAEAIAAYNGLS